MINESIRKVENLRGTLEDIVKENGLRVINDFMDSSRYSAQMKTASLLNKEPIDDEDDEGSHVIVNRLFKKTFEPMEGEESVTIIDVPKEEIEKELETFIEFSQYDGEVVLQFFYNTGYNYGFNEYDGDVSVRFKLIEKDEWYDLYAYYAYIGK